MNCLVIDFGGTYTKYCLMDGNASISEKNEQPSPLVGIEAFTAFIKNLYEIHKSRIEGIAISIPGMIDIKTGLHKGGGAYMDLWGKNLYELIGSVTPLPFVVENDGKCGAMAEVWKGSLEDVNDGVVMIIGTGNAGGIIKDRKIHRGFHDIAGEVSYLMTKPGEYGPSNMLCMHSAMMGLTMKVAAAKGYGQSSLESASLRREDSNVYQGPRAGAEKEGEAKPCVMVDGPQIFRWLEEGDPDTVHAYEEFIADLGMTLFNLHVVYDPEKIAIGGGISRIPRLLPDIQAELNRIQEAIAHLFSPTLTLVPCKFLGDANLVGAMFNFMQRNGQMAQDI